MLLKMKPIQTSEIKDHIMAIHQKSSDDAISDDIQVERGLTPKQIKQAQQKDKFCKEQYNKKEKVLFQVHILITYRYGILDKIHNR